MDNLSELEKFLPTTTDPSIIEQMYEPTEIKVLTLKDLLELPVNPQYESNSLKYSEARFKLVEGKNISTNNNIIIK